MATFKTLTAASLAAALLLLHACSEDRDVPQLAVVTNTSRFVALAWTHPPGPAPDGYQIERSVASGSFQVVERLDPRSLAYGHVFSHQDPEQTVYAFRVRALPDPEDVRASDVASVRRGVDTPFVFCGPGNVVGGCMPVNADHFALNWTPASISPDAFQLERRTISRDFTPITGWAVLLPASMATTYSDTDLSGWVHSCAYEYRLTAIGTAGEPGAPTTASTAFAPP